MQYTLDAEKYPLHDAVVKSALGEYAKHIIELPPGSHSNTSPEIRQYQAATFLRGTNWAWCAAFYDWNWSHIGHPLPYRSAGAFDLNNWAIRANWAVSLRHVLPGDGVCWNVGSGHYSMFLRTEGSYVVTVDGNVGDAVAICKRPASLVHGYMHVPELPQKRLAPVSKHLTRTKPKLWQIVTSANGHRQLVVSGRPLPALLPFITKASKNHKALIIEQVKA